MDIDNKHGVKVYVELQPAVQGSDTPRLWAKKAEQDNDPSCWSSLPCHRKKPPAGMILCTTQEQNHQSSGAGQGFH